jgi:hypothetical protein
MGGTLIKSLTEIVKLYEIVEISCAFVLTGEAAHDRNNAFW